MGDHEDWSNSIDCFSLLDTEPAIEASETARLATEIGDEEPGSDDEKWLEQLRMRGGGFAEEVRGGGFAEEMRGLKGRFQLTEQALSQQQLLLETQLPSAALATSKESAPAHPGTASGKPETGKRTSSAASTQPALPHETKRTHSFICEDSTISASDRICKQLG